MTYTSFFKRLRKNGESILKIGKVLKKNCYLCSQKAEAVNFFYNRTSVLISSRKDFNHISKLILFIENVENKIRNQPSLVTSSQLAFLCAKSCFPPSRKASIFVKSKFVMLFRALFVSK